MKHLSIQNKMVRILFLIFCLLVLITLIIKHFTATASTDEYIILPILIIGFFYIFLTNKIDIWINDKYIRYQWISMKKHVIQLDQIQEIYLKKYKIIIRTKEKDIKLDIFNTGRKNKNLIRDFFKQNINAPVINQVE